MSEPHHDHIGQANPAGPYPPAPAMPPRQQWNQPQRQYDAQLPAVYQGGALAQQPYQVPPVPYTLVPPGARFGAACLDFLLVVVTFGIGWWIWSFITWSSGQSPAKQLLGHVVADPRTGQAFDWGRMAMREFVVRTLLIGMIGGITFGILALVDGFMVFGTNYRTLHDQMAGSIVRYT